MLGESGAEHVYLACGTTDMRKSIDGLAALVSMQFKLDPFSNCWFVFCNRSRNKLKILRWDMNGFWLYYKRLEKGKFMWPETKEAEPHLITRRQLMWLLDGLALTQKHAHREVTARAIA